MQAIGAREHAWLQPYRQPEVRLLAAGLADEALGRDADHGHGGIAHLERLAQRVELAPEAPAPVRVADDGVRHLVPVVRRGEQPANGRPDPEHFEETTGHEPPTALFPAIPLETDLPRAEAALTGHQ